MPRPRITGLGIHIKVADIKRSRQFYDSLGFQPVLAVGEREFIESFPPTVDTRLTTSFSIVLYRHGAAELEIDDGHIGIPDRNVFGEHIQSPKVSAMVHVESLVPLFTNPLVDLRFPVRHYYWGSVEAAFRDPDGFVVVFIAPATPDELRALAAHTNVEVIERPGGQT